MRSGVLERQLSRARAQAFDVGQNVRRVKGWAAARIRDHHRAKVVDGRGDQLAGQAADLGVGVKPVATVMMRKVMHHQRAHLGRQILRRAKGCEKMSGRGGSGGFMAQAGPTHHATALHALGGGRLAEIVGENRKGE